MGGLPRAALTHHFLRLGTSGGSALAAASVPGTSPGEFPSLLERLSVIDSDLSDMR